MPCLRVSGDMPQLIGQVRQANYPVPHKGPRGGSASVGVQAAGTKVTSRAAIPLAGIARSAPLPMGSGWARWDAATEPPVRSGRERRTSPRPNHPDRIRRGNHDQRLSRSAAGVLARRRTERRFRAPRPSLVTGRGARRSSGYARAGLPGRAARSCLPPSGCGRRYVLMTSARMSSWATACIPVVNAVISTGAGTCELVRLRPWCAAPEKRSRQILPNRRARVRCGLPRWRTASLSVSCRPGRCLRPRAGRGIP
jgi:hypothetical protein